MRPACDNGGRGKEDRSSRHVVIYAASRANNAECAPRRIASACSSCLEQRAYLWPSINRESPTAVKHAVARTHELPRAEPLHRRNSPIIHHLVLNTPNDFSANRIIGWRQKIPFRHGLVYFLFHRLFLSRCQFVHPIH